MRRAIRSVAAGPAICALALCICVLSASAQPAPSFQARCGELRAAMAALNGREKSELITIEVAGTLEYLQEGSGLVHLGLCGPPHPRVLCVTYASNGRRLKDRVVVVGSVVPRGPDFIQLDPCLHRLPEREDK
jgi:hypothetical protein